MIDDGTGLRELVAQWRSAAASWARMEAGTEATNWLSVCADELEAALSAVAPPPVLEGLASVDFAVAVMNAANAYAATEGEYPAPKDRATLRAQVARLRAFAGERIDADNESRIAASPATPAQPEGGDAVAWMRDSGVSIDEESAAITDRIKRLWLAANPKRVERYTIPLYTRPGCNLPPAGWYCGLGRGHEGPCPAWPVSHETAADFYARPAPAQPEGGDAAACEIEAVGDRHGTYLTHASAMLRTYNGYAPKRGDKLYTRPAPAQQAGHAMIERAARVIAKQCREDYDFIGGFAKSAFRDRAEEVLTAALTSTAAKAAEGAK